MRRGRPRTEEKRPCPECGVLFSVIGLPNHTRSCRVRQAALVGAAQIARSGVQDARARSRPAPYTQSRPGSRSGPSSGTSTASVPRASSSSSLGPVRRGAPSGMRGQGSSSRDDGNGVHSTEPGTFEHYVDVPMFDDHQDSTANTTGLGNNAAQVPPPAGDAPLQPGLEVDDFMIESHPRSGRPTVVKRFEDFKREYPPVDPRTLDPEPYKPFRSVLDFKFAAFSLETALDKTEVTTLLALIREIVESPSQFTFKSYQDVIDSWDAATRKSAAFKAEEIRVPFLNTHRIYTFYYRPLWDWALSLVRDPILAPLFTWHATRLYKWDGIRWVRFIDEPYTANLWWNIETKLPPRGVPLCFILYADKTRLSSFGTKKGYPIMARIANLPTEIRNSSGFGGGQVVGLLPIVEEEDHEGKLSFTTLKRVVWHDAFFVLLSTIAKIGKLGELFKCGDDILRLLFPIILILAADYEEQTVMALIRGMMGLAPCPVCLVPQDRQWELGTEPLFPLCTVEETKELVEGGGRTKAEVEARLQPYGLRPVSNVFWKIPHCDPYRALSFDRLHAYHGGLFSDHLFAEFQAIIEEMGRPTKVAINARFDAIPRWRGLNHFSEVSKVSFTDGSKYEDISKVIVPATYGVIGTTAGTRGYQLLRSMRVYVVLDTYAGFEVHSAITLSAFKEMLPRFSEEIQKYAGIHPDKNWNFPKAHTHQHVIDDILAKGVTRNYNTKTFESMHRPLKSSYLFRTNFKEVEGQLAKIDHHFLIASIIRSHLVEAGDEPDEDTTPSPSPDFQFGHIYVGSRQPPVTFACLEGDPEWPLPRFHIRLSDYLNDHLLHVDVLPNRKRITLRANDSIIVSRFLKVDYESMITWKLETDYLRCSPNFHGSPRYDHVIYKEDEQTYKFGRLRLLLLYELSGIKYPIAFIERYDVMQGVRRQIDQDLGLCRIRRRSRTVAQPDGDTGFIPARSIVRGALVIFDHAHEGESLVVDTVDADMFLRIQQDFPIWCT